MCWEIANLRSQAKCSAEKFERTSMNDKQNDEIVELVKSIDSSDHGQHALQSIFQEADKAGEGKGDILRGIWEQDVSDVKQFYQDQKQNGEYIVLDLDTVHFIYMHKWMYYATFLYGTLLGSLSVHFGWDTIVQVYNGDIFRAKQEVDMFLV